MRKSIFIYILACLSFLYLTSCDGGNGNGEEEFTVFDVTIRVLEVESQSEVTTDCPESADLKLSLMIDGNSISGFAELIAFGNIGEPIPISGIIEGNNLSLNSFDVGVSGCEVPFFTPEPKPICFLSFGFNTFEGGLLDIDSDGDFDRIEGTLTGSIFSLREIHILCDSQFTGEFSGILRSPEGCLSPVEAPTSECPADGFVNQCDIYDFYSCFGWCEPHDGGIICIDPAFYASECEVIDCLTVNCLGVGIVNLEGDQDFGSISYITPIDTTASCNN